jgi:hypothetical protein
MEKYKKKHIPKSLRNAVWIFYIGKRVGYHECFCGCKNEITPFDYECGHIIAEKNGGSLTLNNLLPICSSCNGSMSTENLFEFCKRVGFIPLTNKSSEYQDKQLYEIDGQLKELKMKLYNEKI